MTILMTCGASQVPKHFNHASKSLTLITQIDISSNVNMLSTLAMGRT